MQYHVQHRVQVRGPNRFFGFPLWPEWARFIDEFPLSAILCVQDSYVIVDPLRLTVAILDHTTAGC